MGAGGSLGLLSGTEGVVLSVRARGAAPPFDSVLASGLLCSPAAAGACVVSLSMEPSSVCTGVVGGSAANCSGVVLNSLSLDESVCPCEWDATPLLFSGTAFEVAGAAGVAGLVGSAIFSVRPSVGDFVSCGFVSADTAELAGAFFTDVFVLVGGSLLTGFGVSGAFPLDGSFDFSGVLLAAGSNRSFAP